MRIRSGLAAVVISVAALAFVGVGSYAGYTSAVSGHVNISTGTFYLDAHVGPTTAYDPNGETVNQGSVPYPWGCDPAGGGTCFSGSNDYQFEVQFSNANPGDTYYFPVHVSDGGTLPGYITNFTYDYSGSDALGGALTIWICTNTPNPSDAGSPCTQINTTHGAIFNGSPLGGSGANVVPGTVGQTYWILEQFSASAPNSTEGASITQTFTINGTSE
jgi:hypothetical protein